jgi:putative protease
MDISHLKILAPVGNFTMLKTAINAGADEIYFGSTLFSMRAGANNFTPNEFSRIAQECHENGIKSK